MLTSVVLCDAHYGKVQLNIELTRMAALNFNDSYDAISRSIPVEPQIAKNTIMDLIEKFHAAAIVFKKNIYIGYPPRLRLNLWNGWMAHLFYHDNLSTAAKFF